MCNIFFSISMTRLYFCFFFQAEDGIRDKLVTGVQTCALPISARRAPRRLARRPAPRRRAGAAAPGAAEFRRGGGGGVGGAYRERGAAEGASAKKRVGRIGSAGVEIGRASCRERV